MGELAREMTRNNGNLSGRQEQSGKLMGTPVDLQVRLFLLRGGLRNALSTHELHAINFKSVGMAPHR